MILKKKSLAGIIIATVIVSVILTVVAICMLLGVRRDTGYALGRFFLVQRYIERSYVDEVDVNKLMDGAIDGMVKSLGDPHSNFLDAEDFERLKEYNDAAFGGIGVTMGFKDDKVTVISVLDDTPGQKAGLQVGDEIVAVDGNEVASQSASDVVMQIRGEVGTEVQLTILRAGEQMDVTLQRDVIHVPTVKGSMLDNGVGYMRISMFAENTDELFTEELQKLEDQDMRGLIIDLRGNPGGLLKSVVKIGKLIVPQGPIVSVKERDGSQREYDSELAETKYPIVVLIDGNSASAAEILAGALQDTGAATLVGTKSYGKGSVQSVIPLTQGEGLKLTIAKYYTPSGRCIDGIGIEPDVEVDLPQDGTVEDTQLAKAREIMQQKLAE